MSKSPPSVMGTCPHSIKFMKTTVNINKPPHPAPNSQNEQRMECWDLWLCRQLDYGPHWKDKLKNALDVIRQSLFEYMQAYLRKRHCFYPVLSIRPGSCRQVFCYWHKALIFTQPGGFIYMYTSLLTGDNFCWSNVWCTGFIDQPKEQVSYSHFRYSIYTCVPIILL